MFGSVKNVFCSCYSQTSRPDLEPVVLKDLEPIVLKEIDQKIQNVTKEITPVVSEPKEKKHPIRTEENSTTVTDKQLCNKMAELNTQNCFVYKVDFIDNGKVGSNEHVLHYIQKYY